MFRLLSLLPARSTLAGGLASIIAWGICLAVQHFTGIQLDQNTVTGIVVSAGTLVTHIVPDSVKDVAKQLDVSVKGLKDVIPEIKCGPRDYPDSNPKGG